MASPSPAPAPSSLHVVLDSTGSDWTSSATLVPLIVSVVALLGVLIASLISAAATRAAEDKRSKSAIDAENTRAAAAIEAEDRRHRNAIAADRLQRYAADRHALYAELTLVVIRLQETIVSVRDALNGDDGQKKLDELRRLVPFEKAVNDITGRVELFASKTVVEHVRELWLALAGMKLSGEMAATITIGELPPDALLPAWLVHDAEMIVTTAAAVRERMREELESGNDGA